MRPTISTARGDKGQTDLFGGTRVSKSSDRIQAYGDVDELNAILGLVLCEDLPSILEVQLRAVQRSLFTLGADLATPLISKAETLRISDKEVVLLEEWGHRLEKELPQLTQFILPSGSRAGSHLHLARTVCRRAERWLVALAQDEEVNEHAMVFVNRLSDYLFLAARMANRHAGEEETAWVHD